MNQALTIADFASRLGVSRMTLHRMRQAGEIPAPIATARRFVRWSRSTVEQWESLGYPSAIEFAALMRTKRRFSQK